MFKMVALALGALALSCALFVPSFPPQTVVDAIVFDAAHDGWAEAGLPDPGPACLARARVTWAKDADELARICGEGAAQCWLGWNVQRAVLPPGASPRDAIHEAMHELVKCTRLSTDIYDYNHTDGRVWVDYPREQPGGVNSAQGRARRIYDDR